MDDLFGWQVQAVARLMDLDGNGSVDYTEFVRALSMTHYASRLSPQEAQGVEGTEGDSEATMPGKEGAAEGPSSPDDRSMISHSQGRFGREPMPPMAGSVQARSECRAAQCAHAIRADAGWSDMARGVAGQPNPSHYAY